MTTPTEPPPGFPGFDPKRGENLPATITDPFAGVGAAIERSTERVLTFLGGALVDVIGNMLLAGGGLVLMVFGVARIFGITPGRLLGLAAARGRRPAGA